MQLAPVDPSISAERIREAVDADKERAKAFSGDVPDRIFWIPTL